MLTSTYIEDLLTVQPTMTEHTIHRYWCPRYKRIVSPSVTEALPNSMIGLRLAIFTAWLHYLIVVSVGNIVKMVSVFCSFKITAGGLTQAWKNLAFLLEPFYDKIGRRVSQSGVLSADETGWRLNGITNWLWGFATSTFCYYRITKSRAAPVVKEVLGLFLQGILICDFCGTYHKISVLAKQKCFYHLFPEFVKVDQPMPLRAGSRFVRNCPVYTRMHLRLSEMRNHLQTKAYHRLKRRLKRGLHQCLAAPYQDQDASGATNEVPRSYPKGIPTKSI